MTEFVGYRLPLQYRRGIIHEHLHCRNHAGFFDISHMGQCLIIGDKAAAGLDRLTPSNISGLNPSQMRYTVLTTEAGGVIDDVVAIRTGNGVMVIVNAACKEKDFLYLKRELEPSCRLLELPEHSLFALQGPASVEALAKFFPLAAGLSFMESYETELDGISCRVSRCGYTGEDGFEISVADSQAEAIARLLLAEDEVEPIGLGARDTLRLEAGLCLYGHELDETVTPVEAGLARLVKKGHNHFPGAARIVKQMQEGSAKVRGGLVFEGKQPVRAGCDLYDEENMLVGRVTSGNFSPCLGKPIAMAYLDPVHAAIGTRLYARIKDRELAASVTALPFIPHRYVKNS